VIGGRRAPTCAVHQVGEAQVERVGRWRAERVRGDQDQAGQVGIARGQRGTGDGPRWLEHHVDPPRELVAGHVEGDVLGDAGEDLGLERDGGRGCPEPTASPLPSLLRPLGCRGPSCVPPSGRAFQAPNRRQRGWKVFAGPGRVSQPASHQATRDKAIAVWGGSHQSYPRKQRSTCAPGWAGQQRSVIVTEYPHKGRDLLTPLSR